MQFHVGVGFGIAVIQAVIEAYEHAYYSAFGSNLRDTLKTIRLDDEELLVLDVFDMNCDQLQTVIGIFGWQGIQLNGACE